MRRKPILIMLLFLSLGLLLSAFYVSAVDTFYSNYYPAKGSKVTVSSPKIAVYVKSLYELDSSTVKMWLNGMDVTPNFVNKSLKEGTISFNTSNLKDGVNTVEVSINDKGGNTLSDSWTFTVAEPPKFNGINPADKSEQLKANQLTAVVSDNHAVNWDTVTLKINNSYVDSTKLEINRETGKITYNYIFPNNSYTAVLEAKDISGNSGTKSWTFTADSAAPSLVNLYYFKDSAVITDGILKFSGELKDLVDIKDNVTLSLDGSPLKINFKYKGYIDYYDEYIITSKKQAFIDYEGTIANGSHTLTLFAEDTLGNAVTRNWNFTVSVKPVVSNQTPLKYGVDDLKPTISAVVKSPNGSINPGSIQFKLDGQPVAFQYDESSGLVSYTPPAVLENEAYHTVNVAASDLTGVSIDKQWKFYTNTYPDMKDSNISSCTSCHQANSFTGSNGDLENVHSKKLYFNGTHSNNRCENCHNYISVPANCSQCHEDPDGDAFDLAPHGSTPTIHYQPVNTDPTMPLRVTENREMNDCIVCHQPGSQVKGYTGAFVTPTRLLNNHDIPELHKANNEPDCTGCHAKSLTHEHARDGRQDANGNPITCNTCHQSTNPAVVQAIKDKNTSCTSCHSRDTVHKDIHSKCANCHSKGSYEDSRHAN
ncbi:cytochrome c3 family protein [Neobacillus sp. GCM10023253]